MKNNILIIFMSLFLALSSNVFAGNNNLPDCCKKQKKCCKEQKVCCEKNKAKADCCIKAKACCEEKKACCDAKNEGAGEQK
ncbi:MAG: hypothetical protein ACK40G_08720 [Cytophagaceae bacterium]